MSQKNIEVNKYSLISDKHIPIVVKFLLLKKIGSRKKLLVQVLAIWLPAKNIQKFKCVVKMFT